MCSSPNIEAHTTIHHVKTLLELKLAAWKDEGSRHFAFLIPSTYSFANLPGHGLQQPWTAGRDQAGIPEENDGWQEASP